jgi:hypothetical protein
MPTCLHQFTLVNARPMVCAMHANRLMHGGDTRYSTYLFTWESLTGSTVQGEARQKTPKHAAPTRQPRPAEAQVPCGCSPWPLSTVPRPCPCVGRRVGARPHADQFAFARCRSAWTAARSTPHAAYRHGGRLRACHSGGRHRASDAEMERAVATGGLRPITAWREQRRRGGQVGKRGAVATWRRERPSSYGILEAQHTLQRKAHQSYMPDWMWS